MNRYKVLSLCYAIVVSMLLFSRTGYAGPDGLNLSATTLKLNEELTITFGSSSYCKIRMQVLGLENQGTVFSGPQETKVFNPPAQYKVKFTKSGKYRVWAEKLDGTPGICGNMPLSAMQKDIQVMMPISASIGGTLASAMAPPAGQCPIGYTKDAALTPDEVKKGALKCVKTPVSCPQGWTGSLDSSTGNLTCTLTNSPTCPVGWHGSVQNGKLVCNPLQQPTITCPTSTPDWQWGAKYYSQSWNILGCTPNVKPAY